MSATQHTKQSGVVSIFTVIFFMIFISVIVVGYIKIVNDDQGQAIDNDLSASALAAARGGAEDGKRLLLFCADTAALTADQQSACNSALDSSLCTAITANSILTSALTIGVDTSDGRHDGIVTGNEKYDQRYTCMTIQTKTASVEGIGISANTSEIVPLKAVSDTFSSAQISWHANADNRDGQLKAFRNNIQLPSQDNWNDGTNPYAAALRLEFIAYKKSDGINLGTLDSYTRTLFVVPGSSGLSTATLAYDVRSSDPNADPSYEPILARCNGASEYACTITIGGLDSSQYTYFVRTTALYTATHVKIEMKDSGGNIVNFDNVQPVIDVTGRTNDVFRRIQTRVQYDATTYLPQYAIETGTLCKNMVVADTVANSSDACNP